MYSLLKSLKEYKYATLLLFLITMASFISKVINLNYNSPFNDEAIYVVVGKLGIFQWDWSTYNARAWMAGLPYIYPSLTALAHTSFGIIGSRFLNVIFGILTLEAIFVIAFFLTETSPKYKIWAGLISSSLVGGAAVNFYVSRLATYDLPSFYFLIASIMLLILAKQDEDNPSKLFFLSFIFLAIGFGIKIITGIYIPLIIGISFISLKKDGDKLKLWKYYFLYPICLVLILYTLLNLGNLLTFYKTQASREVGNVSGIIKSFWDNTTYIWAFWLAGSLGMLLTRQWKKLAVLTTAAVVILAFHLVTSRIPTLDKHSFLSYTFLSLVSGIGIASALATMPPVKIIRPFLIGNLIGVIVAFWIVSYQESQKYNSLWTNANQVLSYVSSQISPGDKILTEIGAAALLSVYDKDHPSNVTTFDWFSYGNILASDAYAEATFDGYFNFLVLESQVHPKSDHNRNLHGIIINNLSDNYSLAYASDGFLVFKRNY